MNSLKLACRLKILREFLTSKLSPRTTHHSLVTTHLFGLHFKNPVGLGAGFDKNALYLTELDRLGFGFVEVGTVTPKPQAGNLKPRLFRLPKDKALINRMGFNNDGVKVIAERLKKWRELGVGSRESGVGSQESDVGSGEFHSQHSRLQTHDSRLKSDSRLRTHDSRLIIGGNIGKNKDTPNEEAWKDYEICFKELFEVVDYFVVNVSSPNTPGLRELQEKDSLRKILSHLQILNAQLTAGQQPKSILLKIAPDLTEQQIDDVIDLALEIKLDGIVATNTTVSRERLVTSSEQIQQIGAGGLSGRPLKEKSTAIVRYIHQKTKGEIPIVASGGIFTAEDAEEKFAAGASLIQVWTGFIYEGPGIVKKILNRRTGGN